MAETVDEVVKPASAASRGSFSQRAVIEEDIDGTSLAGEDTTSADAIGGRIERRIPDSIKDKLAWLSGSGDDDDDDDDDPAGDATTTDPAAADPKAVITASGDKTAAPADPAKPAVAPVPDPSAEHITRAERAEAANRALLAEVDGYKKQPTSALPKGVDKLVAAADKYLENPRVALKQLVAHVFGLDDPEAPEVAAELRDLYTDLTAEELGTSVDAAHQAKREAARTRQLWARDKRQQKANEEQAVQAKSGDPDEQQIAKAGDHILGLRDEGKSLIVTAEAHPHLFALAEHLDGKKPGEIVARVLQREIRTGRIDPQQSDATLAKLAADIAENHFQAIADKALAARTKKPSTETKPSDTKSPAAAESARTEQRQSHGARNLTAADASVAPATPPATPKPAEKPKFKSRQDRLDHSWNKLRQQKH